MKKITNLYVAILLFACMAVPFLAAAQNGYEDDNGNVFAANDSRLTASIVETDHGVTLRVIALGSMKFTNLSFKLVYQSSALTLVDSSFNDIALSSNIENVIEINPDINLWETTAKHVAITAGSATGMRYVHTGVSTTASAMQVSSGEMLHLYTIYFKKNESGTPLAQNDLGYYVPYLSGYGSGWTSGAKTITDSIRSTSTSFYKDAALVTFRSAAAVNLNSVQDISGISGASVVVNATLISGTTSGNMIKTSERGVIKNIGTLKKDIPTRYGFIYTNSDGGLDMYLTSKDLRINGVDYAFPNATEIAAGSFIRGEMTFYIRSFTENLANNTINYTDTLKNLTCNSMYHVWPFVQYTFETSDVYVTLGDKLPFYPQIPHFNVLGTVFPFIYHQSEYPEDSQDPDEIEEMEAIERINALHAVTANLYHIPAPGEEDLILFGEATPAYSTTAVYYDGSKYAAETPQNPGVMARTDNPGLPIDWSLAGKTGSSNTDYITVQPGEIPTRPVGLYEFSEVQAGNYILGIFRPGFIPRFGRVTINENGTLGHREIVGFDLNGDLMADAADISILRTQVGKSILEPNVDPAFDLNGNGFVGASDVSLSLALVGNTFEMYVETLEWIESW